MRTFTPELDKGTLRRLAEYAAQFLPDFARKDQARWTEAYLRGLLQDGDRKSVEPLVNRITLPSQCECLDPIQAIQHFLNQGGWEAERVFAHYRAVMAARFASPDGVFVFDDTSFPKQGKHSVGVQRQYCGASGKKANCQVAVSVHYVSPAGHYPLAMRLHLPDSWTKDAARLDEGKVPPEHRDPKTKHKIALELLDQVLVEGLPGRIALADAGYGQSDDFRAELAKRGLLYVVGVKGQESIFTAPPTWIWPAKRRKGPAPTRPRLDPRNPRPKSIEEIAAELPLRRCTWREGTKGKLSARFARMRVWPAHRWTEGSCFEQEPVWLIVEERGKELRYALSNAAESISMKELVNLLKSRWPVEQGYQQLKEELGLDHFEGRSWKGFHHHVSLVFLAYGFLALELARLDPKPLRGLKKKGPRENSWVSSTR